MDQQQLRTEETLSQLQALRSQEERFYTVRSNYLGEITSNNNMSMTENVDLTCRTMMVQWIYQILDYCQYSKETGEHALSLLDRACENDPALLQDRSLYQLASMTALYTIVKIHEHEAMDPQLISNLSKGAHSVEAIEAMERRLLKAVQWTVNNPTCLSFATLFVELLPPMEQSVKSALLDLVNLQCETSVKDYDLVQTPASTVALCALSNALEGLGMSKSISEDMQGFVHSLSQSGINVDLRPEVCMCLYAAIAGDDIDSCPISNNKDDGMEIDNDDQDNSCRSDCVHSSPRSVQQQTASVV